MSAAIPDLSLPVRGSAWKWGVCVLLLLATTINYMDRLTLNQLSGPIKESFALDARGYAQLEAAFASAFALGAILMGWLVDRWNVRWIYPIAVLAWSFAGFATGLAQTFAMLLACRFLLGLAEAGNWPCALKATQQILPPAERTFGNSILQSGAAFGAVITPMILLALFNWTGNWRVPFMVIGAVGTLWVAFWLSAVRPTDLRTSSSSAGPSLMSVLAWLILLMMLDGAVHIAAAAPDWLPHALQAPAADLFAVAPWLPLASKALVTVLGILGVFLWLWNATRDDDGVPRHVFFARFWVLSAITVLINATWHFFRVWMPPFLQEQHGYDLHDTSWFSTAYYISTDIGSLASGYAALTLARRGLSVHRSRVIVFAFCTLLTTLAVVAALLPRGPMLLIVMLVIGFGALGLYPAYYSFSQELTTRNQGKLTGALGCVCWLSMALLQEGAGDLIKRTGSYTLGVSIAGLFPVLALAAILCFWGRAPSVRSMHDESPFIDDPRGDDKLQTMPASDAIQVGSPGAVTRAS
jgi:ACS family hexuronate transporter-like MFS transporter